MDKKKVDEIWEELLKKSKEKFISTIKENQQEDFGGRCILGLNVKLNITESECNLWFDIDHIQNIEIEDLLSEGRLFEELFMLFELACLPYAQSYCKNITVQNTHIDIIDRVKLNMDKAFHPYNKEEYKVDDYGMYQDNPSCTEPEHHLALFKGLKWLRKHKPR